MGDGLTGAKGGSPLHILRLFTLQFNPYEKFLEGLALKIQEEKVPLKPF